MMKRTAVITVFLLAILPLSAQIKTYEQRYNLLVSKLGPAGVGVETVLDNWAKADSTDGKLLAARFNYYYTKSQRTEVVRKSSKKYLGMSPLLSLKDSLGADVHYYQETFHDDQLYAKALKYVDKAIELYPDRIDYRFMKANAYISYEKESPDMALAYLLDLIGKDAVRNGRWMFEERKTDVGFFEGAMQEYCYSFYTIGSRQAMDAFFALSRKMNEYHPDNVVYINNIGSYYLVAKDDCKTALKYYRKVLKKAPSDKTALTNGLIAARKLGNRKLEVKYRQALSAQTITGK